MCGTRHYERSQLLVSKHNLYDSFVKTSNNQQQRHRLHNRYYRAHLTSLARSYPLNLFHQPHCTFYNNYKQLVYNSKYYKVNRYHENEDSAGAECLLFHAQCLIFDSQFISTVWKFDESKSYILCISLFIIQKIYHAEIWQNRIFKEFSNFFLKEFD